jgi:hypothetical protein
MNFVKYIKDLEKESLSDIDILKYVNNKSNLVTYPEISDYKDIDELLGPYQCCIILFLTKWKYGHWTCLFKVYNKRNTLEFFDSYGTIPDKEKEFIEDGFLKESDQERNYLSELLYKSGYNIIYNEHKLQKKEKGIATCGKFCSVRINYRDIPHKKFCKLLMDKKYDPDFLVTCLCLNY